MNVTIHNQSKWNHGCQDWATVEIESDNQGIVTFVNTCQSCWQVGHDSGHVFLRVGERVQINSLDQYGESEEWRVL